MDLQSFLRLKQLIPQGASLAQPGLDTYSNSMDSMPDTSDVGGSNMPISAPDTTDIPDTYSPKHDVANKLSAALGNMPVRPQPGAMRRIAATAAAFGAGGSPMAVAGGQPIGYRYNPDAAKKAADEVNYGDYNQKLSDWQNQIKALGIGANEEDRANTNERIRANDVMKNEVKQRETEVRQQRADTYQQMADAKEVTETQKHEYSMRKLSDAVAIADKKLMLAKQQFDLKKNSTEAMQAYHNAELASLKARRDAQTEDEKFKREQLKRKNDSIIERNRILNEKTTNQGGPRTTTQSVYDSTGKLTDRKVTRTGPEEDTTPMMAPDGNVYHVPNSKVKSGQAAKDGFKPVPEENDDEDNQ